MCKNLILDDLCRGDHLTEYAEEYIRSCHHTEKGEKDRFANIAGFCRRFGLGSSDIERMKKEFPEYWSALCLIFEDEALNSDIPATVLSAYLKKRLGYDGNSPSDEPATINLIFEHDIETDGR